jgi:cytochrome c biogenesis protein CcdA/thiol-disulfide isomerase/thioredoxin
VLLLLLFGLLAGAATAVSPCVLPVLPIVLSGGATGGRRRPLGIVLGLTATFTFSAVALVYVISALGLPDDLVRTLAIVTLLVFGVVLAVPALAARVEGALSRIAPAPVRREGDGLGTGLLLGAGLGFVYAPCAGPILAGVITTSASQPFGADRLAVALAYGVGTGVVLYVLMRGGRRLTRPLARRSGAFQVATGAVMVLLAVGMLGDLDLRFQTWIAKDLPQALVTPTGALERSDASRTRLQALAGRREGPIQRAAAAATTSRAATETAPTDALDPRDLPALGHVPAFVGTQDWFNTPGDRPLTFAGLQRQRRVVLVDFWTYTCINCLRTIPALNTLYRRYHDDGLEIVGIHSPEFPFEKNATSVRKAIAREGIRYPVVQDNGLATWTAFGNRAWPAQYLVDADGQVRYTSEGEGHDDTTEKAIRTLLHEAGHDPGRRAGDLGAVEASPAVRTPESYLGTDRAERIAGGEPTTGTHDTGAVPARLAANEIGFGGRLAFAGDHVTARRDGRIALDFTARHVYLVLRADRRARVGVRLDGRTIAARDAGADVRGGRATVATQRLYELVDLPRAGHHRLDLALPDGVEAYAFTFG